MLSCWTRKFVCLANVSDVVMFAHFVFLSRWWNVAAENQAMNRIHRISSKKPVRCYRLVMKDTLEHRMLGLQDAKELLGKGAMERLSREEKRKARLTQLRDLFQLPETLEQDWEDY